jgi:hypothetical protein
LSQTVPGGIRTQVIQEILDPQTHESLESFSNPGTVRRKTPRSRHPPVGPLLLQGEGLWTGAHFQPFQASNGGHQTPIPVSGQRAFEGIQNAVGDTDDVPEI